MTDTVKALRKALNKRIERKFADGTVIRFIRELPSYAEGLTNRYTYVAVYVSATDKWYLSALAGTRVYLTEDFLDLLADVKTIKVDVASEWGTV